MRVYFERRKLEKLRREKGLSQKQIASFAGRSHTTWQNWVHHRSTPTFNELLAICNGCGVDIEYFLEEIGNGK